MPDILIGHEPLTQFITKLLITIRVPQDAADLVAESLVAASLRGVDSHGVQLLPFYIERMRDGGINIERRGHIATENGACLTYDGEGGIGQVISAICSDHAVRIAKEHGIGLAIARESNHFGAAAFWAQRVSRQGMIGMVMCNASPIVLPWQGKDKRFGTNPICVSLPGPDQWLLDMATTTVAMGKILKAVLNKQPSLPHGWALDINGVPTNDPQAGLDGSPMPLGGYKGSGLAMMAEIFCAVLSGGAMSTELGGIRITDRPMRTSQFFLAIDVARFMPLDEFAARIRQLVGIVKSSEPAPGYDEVLVAGDPEWRAEAARRIQGVPVFEGTWGPLCSVAAELGVEVPPVHTSNNVADR
ncbi:MAG TPA: Ldh family oxidoreductase [Bryobacteraceae bacterium]|nr:Ldh family oxidoreductase [Bryobacteraceae bacterium]